MKKKAFFSVTLAAAVFLPMTANAAVVLGTTSAGQAIGSVVAGMKYTITASGTVNLCPDCNGGGPLTFNPDGTLATPGQGAYTPFNSGPKDYDPSVGTTAYGYYGKGINYGELYGSYVANPSGGDLFALGYGTTFTASTTGVLYGTLNDSGYSNNSGQFNVNLAVAASPGAVPEPASWAMMIVGLGMIGAGMRYRQRRMVLRYI